MQTDHLRRPEGRECPSSERLAEFLAGRLSAEELESVGRHTAACTSCQSFLETHRDSTDNVREALRMAGDIADFSNEPEFLDLKRRAKSIRAPHPSDERDSYPSQRTTRELSTHDAIKTNTWHGTGDSEFEEFLRAELLRDEGPQRGDEIPEKIDKYFVLRQLGRGGFATVYLAKDPESNRLVAIKVPRRDKLNSEHAAVRFLKEARTAAALQHPSIVQVYDWGRLQDGSCYVVMEYIEGCSLRALALQERLDHQRIVELLIPIAEGLHYAHRRGIYHRDIKPPNIMIDKQGRPHIADFGLALNEEDRWQHKYELAGTFVYMSPEQVRGKSHLLDGRTDVWSLGVMFYELLTRKRPFSGKSNKQLFETILTREPASIGSVVDGVPDELAEICMKCLQKSASERYPDAAAVAADLRKLAPAQRAPTTLRRLLAPGVAVAATLLLLVVVGSAAVINYRDAGSTISPAEVKPPDQVTLAKLDDTPWTDVSLAGWSQLFPNEEPALIEYDAADNTLHVASRRARAIRIGALTVDDIPYRMRFRMTIKNDDEFRIGPLLARSGVLLGHRPAGQIEGVPAHTFQELSIREWANGHKPDIDRWFMNWRISKIGDHLLIGSPGGAPRGASQELPPHARENGPVEWTYHIEFGVTAQGMEEVTVNGKPQEGLVAADVNGETTLSEYVHDFGILNTWGDVTFSDFQIKTVRSSR